MLTEAAVKKNLKDSIKKLEDGVSGYNEGYAGCLEVGSRQMGKTREILRRPAGKSLSHQKGWRTGWNDAENDLKRRRSTIWTSS